MQIRRADAMGMCFGVRDALAAMQALDEPDQVTIHGELVHNEVVLRDLAARGFRQQSETGRGAELAETERVLVTAHGISQRERARLEAAGKKLIDTTCPLVQRAHEAAQLLQADGRRVVVLGRREHVEVQGIVEDLEDAIVIRGEADVSTWGEARLGVVCQTTTPTEQVDRVMAEIRRCNPAADVQLIDTVCSPTKARGAALESLLPHIDALVVVGGRDSNNTRRLAARGRERGIRTVHVQGVEGLDVSWFDGVQVVGLTAGTSTLADTIDAVHRWLSTMAAASPTPRAG